MEVSQIVLLTLFILVGGIFGLVVVPAKNRALMAIIIVLINAVLTSIPSVLALTGKLQTASLVLRNLTDSVIDIRIDSLSAWFILIINFTTINGALFGSGYLKSYQDLKTNIGFHWIFYILFHISMIWVCMFDNGIIFLISWELMSISSLMLVIFEYQKKSTLKAGINYMIQMHLSVVFLTIGFIWLFTETGSFNLSSLASVFSNNHSIWIFVLFFIGFAIKAGFLPFHTWLPHAHPAAPSHVSGVMSGVIVKLGIFGIFRIISYLNHDWFIIGEIILSLSVITALYGIANAAVKYDYKKSLAFCTIENIGIIGIGIGLGLIGIGTHMEALILLGFGGALLHTLNHSLFKSLLFFSAGSVYQQTHTRNIERLGGLIKTMPVTAMFFLFGALAIGGLPPFNGFISEYLIYSGLFKGLFSVTGISNVILIVLSIVGLVLVGGISIISFTKLFGIMFLGHPRTELPHKPREASFIMLLPQYFIVAIMLSLAFFPQFYFGHVINIIHSIFTFQLTLTNPQIVATSTNLATIGHLSLYFTLLLVLVFTVRFLLLRKRKNKTYKTWSCGYVGPIPKAQYTGRSYARTFGNLLGFVLIERKNFDKISKALLYPTSRKFSSYYFDVLEKYLVMPITKRVSFILNYFQFIQNGKIQSYVIYGLIFILIVFIGTVLNLIV
jgi:hydrogenase-4 component B